MKLEEQRLLEAEAVRMHDEVDRCQCKHQGTHYGYYLQLLMQEAEEALERLRNPDRHEETGSILEALTEARKAQGKTQGEVAKLMGVSQGSVSQFEAGKNDPRLSTLMRYAKTLDMTLMVRSK